MFVTLANAIQLTYVDQTTMSPLAAAIIALFCVVLMLGKRPTAMAAMLGVICVIPTAQRISLAGLDLDPLRLLIIVGFVRVIARGELSTVAVRQVDRVFFAYVVVGWSAYCVLHGFAAGAVIYRCGELFTVAGVYTLCRCFLRSPDDVRQLASLLAIIALPVSVIFAIEWSTSRNMFSVFGRVPEFTGIRQGRLRCQGPFPHPILAGCYWAGVIPIVAVLFWSTNRKPFLACLGVMAALFIVIACSSSTPAMMVAVIVFLAVFYPIRRVLPVLFVMFAALSVVRWVITGYPPWHLISRIDIVGGSTGWQRYHLMDQAIRRFSEWCLVGTRSTAHWGWGLHDVTNQYLLEGVRGGVLSMLLFSLVLVLAFQSVMTRSQEAVVDRRVAIMRWCLVCALAAHAVAFFAVSYFGGVQVIYWTTIAAAIAMGTVEPTHLSYVIEWHEFDEDHVTPLELPTAADLGTRSQTT